MPQKDFAFAKRDIVINGFQIYQNDVGIISNRTLICYSTYFIKIDQTVDVPTSEIEIFNINQTGDQFPKKVCNVCCKIQPTENFAKNQNGKNNRTVRRPSCRTCRITIDGENVSSTDRTRWKRTKPNLEPFTCPICRKTTVPGLTSKVVLDHDHNTGRVRGWICDSCNTGIGRFKDNIELLKSAISYLEIT